jgi:hypothetical protein
MVYVLDADMEYKREDNSRLWYSGPIPFLYGPVWSPSTCSVFGFSLPWDIRDPTMWIPGPYRLGHARVLARVYYWFGASVYVICLAQSPESGRLMWWILPALLIVVNLMHWKSYSRR